MFHVASLTIETGATLTVASSANAIAFAVDGDVDIAGTGRREALTEARAR